MDQRLAAEVSEFLPATWLQYGQSISGTPFLFSLPACQASLPDQDLSAYRAVAKKYAQLVPNERRLGLVHSTGAESITALLGRLREERGRACFAQRKKPEKKQRKTPPPGMSVHYSGFIGPYFYKSTGSIFDGWWESCGFTFSSVQDLFHDCWTPSFT